MVCCNVAVTIDTGVVVVQCVCESPQEVTWQREVAEDSRVRDTGDSLRRKDAFGCLEMSSILLRKLSGAEIATGL